MADRDALIRVLQDAVWPFLAHDPENPDVFWNQMARKIEEHYAVEVDRLRAQVAAVEELLEGPDAPLVPWKSWVRAAMASGDE